MRPHFHGSFSADGRSVESGLADMVAMAVMLLGLAAVAARTFSG